MPSPRTPLLTVDLVIEMVDRAARPIVLIERRNPPYGWALPGGFVDIGERLEAAARREALEETGLTVELKALLGCYSDPTRVMCVCIPRVPYTLRLPLVRQVPAMMLPVWRCSAWRNCRRWCSITPLFLTITVVTG